MRSGALRALRWALPVALLLLVAAAFAAGAGLRSDLGIEWSVESVRAWVLSLGVKAPVIFVGLVTFRQFLLLPSAVVLTAGGLLFGALAGAVLGGVGIVLSASLLFFLARLLGDGWVRPRMHARFPSFERRAETAGPLLIGLMTGHPMGVMTPFHLGAGVSGISWLAFVGVVLLTGPVRAASYALLGAHLLEVGSAGFWLASAAMLAVVLLPLAHPVVRARIFSRSAPASAGPPGSAAQ